MVGTSGPLYVTILRLIGTQVLCSLLPLARGNQVLTNANNPVSKNIFRPYKVCFFLPGSFRFWGSSESNLQGKESGRCETSLCFFCSVSHCYLHGSDTIYLTVHLVLLCQGKSHKTSLVHQHFHCV